MKFIGFLLIIGSFLLASPGSQANDILQGDPLSLSVVTYNIRVGGDNLEGMLHFLAEKKPDILLLQEVHGPPFIPRFVNQAEAIANRLSYHYVFGKTRNWLSGEYGVAIVSRYPLREIEKIPLPNLPGEEPEILLVAQTLTPQGPVWLATVHLISRSKGKNNRVGELRYQQARTILQVLNQKEGPLIFGGDLNSVGFSRIKKLFSMSMTDVFQEVGKGRNSTFPSGFPLLRLDYIYVRGSNLKPQTARVWSNQISDHRPLWSQIELVAPRIAGQ